MRYTLYGRGAFELITRRNGQKRDTNLRGGGGGAMGFFPLHFSVFFFTWACNLFLFGVFSLPLPLAGKTSEKRKKSARKSSCN
jgi:hypothetical protein